MYSENTVIKYNYYRLGGKHVIKIDEFLYGSVLKVTRDDTNESIEKCFSMMKAANAYKNMLALIRCPPKAD